MSDEKDNVSKKFFTKEEIENYRNEVVHWVLANGGGEGDARFVKEELVLNGLRNGRDPKDVAWAVLQ